MSAQLLERSSQSIFERRLQRVTQAGIIKLPPELVALQNRLRAFQRSGGTPIRDRIINAIVDNDETVDLAALKAEAIAEGLRDNDTRREVEAGIHAGVNQKVRALYAEHAAGYYDQIAKRFNAAAKAFTDAANIISPEATADEVVSASDKIRKAWAGAGTHASHLDNLLTPLAAAAALCGKVNDLESHDDALLALAVDVDGQDRETLFTAWDIKAREARAQAQISQGFTVPNFVPSRTGRWGALLSVGATIRATPLDQYRDYGRCEPQPAEPPSLDVFSDA